MIREANTACVQCLVSSRVSHEIEMLCDALVKIFATRRTPWQTAVRTGWSTDLIPQDRAMLSLAVSSGAIRRYKISALTAAEGWATCWSSFCWRQSRSISLPLSAPGWDCSLMSKSKHWDQHKATKWPLVSTPPSPFPPSCRSPAVLQTLHSGFLNQVNASQQIKSPPKSALPAIRPRPQNVAGADSTAEAAPLADVVITSAMIEALRGQPLPAAARAV